MSGAKVDVHRFQVEQLLAPLRILPCGERAAALAAEIRRDLEAAGTKIGMADYLIAGICITHSALLLTRNRRHFERVSGLRFEDLTPA